jgi:hypothetical protein
MGVISLPIGAMFLDQMGSNPEIPIFGTQAVATVGTGAALGHAMPGIAWKGPDNLPNKLHGRGALVGAAIGVACTAAVDFVGWPLVLGG